MEEKDWSVSYITNPDVVLREEDDDGGLLFNPDTNQIRVLNHTGLYVWKRCDGTNNIESIIEGLKNDFENTPENGVAEQVAAFVEDMKANGFLGVSDI